MWLSKELLTCHFKFTENYENYESGCERIWILCRRSVREEKLRIINMLISKKENDDKERDEWNNRDTERNESAS